MYVHSVYDFYFSCTYLFPNASKYFADKTDGGVETVLASSHLGKAVGMLLAGVQACLSEPRGPSRAVTGLPRYSVWG